KLPSYLRPAVLSLPLLVAYSSCEAPDLTQDANKPNSQTTIVPGGSSDRIALQEMPPNERDLAFYKIDKNSLTSLDQIIYDEALAAIDDARNGDIAAADLKIQKLSDGGVVKRDDVRDVVDWIIYNRARAFANQGFADLALSTVHNVDGDGEVVNEVARDAVERHLAGYVYRLADGGFFGEALSVAGSFDDIGEEYRVIITDEVETIMNQTANKLADGGFYEKALEMTDKFDSEGTQVGVVARDDIEYKVAKAALKLANNGDNSDAKKLAKKIDDQGRVTRAEVLRAVNYNTVG
nr:hypothetical protein [Patescibacteria group bacterium]